MVKSKLTIVCTETTSGVDSPARIRYAVVYRFQCRAEPVQPRAPARRSSGRGLFCPVAERRQVGDQARRTRTSARPTRRSRPRRRPRPAAAELRPHRHRVRVRHHPVEAPGAAHVEQREHPGAGHGEQRHRLGEPVDRRPPLLLHQQQDRRDQGPGVADPDPPDEVDDREAPHHRAVQTPDADPPKRSQATEISSTWTRRSRSRRRASSPWCRGGSGRRC